MTKDIVQSMLDKRSSDSKDSLFSRITNRIANKLGIVTKSQFKSISLWTTETMGLAGNNDLVKKWGLKKPGISFKKLFQIYKYDALISICVDLIKDTVSQCDWNISEKGKQKKIELPDDMDQKDRDDEGIAEGIKKFNYLFNNVNNNGENFRLLLSRVLEDLLIYDAGAIEKVSNSLGEIVGINSVDGTTIRPVYNQYGEFGDPAYLQVIEQGGYNSHNNNSRGINNDDPRGQGAVAEFKANEMIYMMANPQNSVELFSYGMSPIEAILLEVQSSLNASIHNAQTFDEDNIPPGMLDLGDVSREKAMEFMQLWNYTTNNNKHKMKFVYGSENTKKYTPFKTNNRDMQFVEYTDWLSRIKLAKYGLSSLDANITQDVNRSTSETQFKMSNARGVRKYKRVVEEYLTREIIKSEGYENIEFKFEKASNVDEEKIQSEIDKMDVESGILSADEVRIRRGYLPIAESEDYTVDTEFDDEDIEETEEKKL